MIRYDFWRARYATLEDDKVMRQAHPIGWPLLKKATASKTILNVPKVGKIVSEASLMRGILLDSEHFSKVGKGASSDLWTPIIGSNGLINMDGEAHAHLRKQLSPLFTAKFVKDIVDETLRPHMERMSESLLAGESVDMAKEAEESAALVIAKLTGFNIDEHNREDIFNKLMEARSLTGAVKLTKPKRSPREVKIAKQKLSFLNESTGAAYDEGRMDTVPGRLRNEGLSKEDAIAVVSAMIIAGTETIISFVPRMTALFIESGYIHHLIKNPEDISNGINEALRVVVPTPVMLRSVIKDTEIDGVQFKVGERAVLATVNACHRAGDFNPFKPVPKDMRNIWFGAGVHFCIGMPLAMAQANLFAETLVNTFQKSDTPIVVSKKAAKKVLAASYESLVIKCQA